MKSKGNEEKICPVCLNTTEWIKVEEWNEYVLFRCEYCDVVFSQPFKAKGSGWYENDEIYKTAKFSKNIYWHHRQFLSHTVLGRTILDVGCNNGVFLAEAEKMGYDVTGLDFNRYAIEAGKQAFGLKKLYCCTLDEFSTNFPSERFDVITFFEILEHLEDPNKFIETIKGMLNPKGFIALSVPNRHMVVNSLGATDYPPHHLTKWSSKAIKTFLESHGLTIVAHRIKDVASEDLATWLDYNYIRKIDYALRKRVKNMAIDGMEKKWQRGETNSLSLFLKIRKLQLKILSGFFYPVAYFLKILGKQGFGHYILCRLE